MINTILTWLAGWILKNLASRFESAIQDHLAAMELAKKRKEANEHNVAAYEEAKDRASRIRAAEALLNRSGP